MRANIPLFPLPLLPLPGELVPLHIFEPRYRQLLADLEIKDSSFGILCNDPVNKRGIGSLMRLEGVIKRYPDGKSDVIVKCEDVFTVSTFLEYYRDKLYPGGKVSLWQATRSATPDARLQDLFREYLNYQSIHRAPEFEDLYEIAGGLNLSVADRYMLLTLPPAKIQDFLWNRLRLQVHVLEQEYRSQEVFHLN